MSNGGGGLAILKQEKRNILLTEIAAVLHDIGKFCDLHVEANSIDGTKKWSNNHAYKAVSDDPSSIISLNPSIKKPAIIRNVLNANSPKIADFLPKQIKEVLDQTRITLHNESYTLAELIMISAPGFSTNQKRSQLLNGKNGWLAALLGLCHHEAHYDKPEKYSIIPQTFSNTLNSSAFGYEKLTFRIGDPNKSLDVQLHSLPISTSALNNNRRTLVINTLAALENGLGETRRPINEVTLDTWSSSVNALFKSALAGSLLDSKQKDIRNWLSWPDKIIDHDLQWRLLHISFDGLRFLERAPRISDLLGRKDALKAALDYVRKLLEETYPLGNEVYRDENGSAFVVPALDGDNDQGNRLRGLIEGHILDTFRQQSKLEGELSPHIHITKPDKQAAVLHEALQNPTPPIAPFQENLRRWWQNQAADICTTCGVRPQGWGAPNHGYKQKAQARNICYTCLERRSTRAKTWAKARNKTGDERKPWERTIWVNEVADNNGRLALIVGKFDLSQWLTGDMIQTLLVVCDPDNNQFEPKNPSFARIQRVWRTTQQFWQNAQNKDLPSATLNMQQYRMEIAVTNKTELRDKLGEYHSYETEINGRRLGLVWDHKSGHLITADNLRAWSKGQAEDSLINQLPNTLPLFEGGGYGQQRRALPSAKIDRDRSQVFPVKYTPIISLLAEPNAFMALVPATAALDAATKINQRYELEMSKVRNRLPLFLGLVFFDRRQSLFSALDAGRRLLKHSFSKDGCTVNCNCEYSRDNGDGLPDHLDHDHFAKWQKMDMITQNDERLHWNVSTVMGDGKTYDDWYPYVEVRGDVSNRRKKFQHNGSNYVHVREVRNWDTIIFRSSRFAWLHLDSSARRFTVGQETRCMEELERIITLWRKLKKLAANNQLSDSQLQAIVTLLMAKGKSWGKGSEEFRQLANAVLRKEGLDTLSLEDLRSERLQATVDLYHHILKQKLSS